MAYDNDLEPTQPNTDIMRSSRRGELGEVSSGDGLKSKIANVWARLRNEETPAIEKLSESELHERNEKLAERLEALEDRTWEIRESEEIYRSLAEAFGDIVLHRDQQGRVVFCNEPFKTHFSSDMVLPNFGLQDIGNTGSISEETLAPRARDVLLETKTGPRWFSWTDLSIRDPQTGQVGWRSVARDITDRKIQENDLKAALEKAGSASQAKSRFLAMVSHEIRTPLNGVVGMAGLLEGTNLDPAQKAYVDAISTSGQTLLSLIEDLLDTTRIESGHLALTAGPTHLTKLVEDVAEILAPQAREKGLILATHISRAVPDDVIVDAGRLRQVLLNIAGNAVKFTQSGGVSITVSLSKTAPLEGDHSRLKFSISDSGPGLAKQDHERIFEEFIQTESGATRQFGGAGLGLSISRKIINAMGGDITVLSEMGKGAVFNFDVNAGVTGSFVPDLKNPPLSSNAKTLALVLKRSPARQCLVQMARENDRRVAVFDDMASFLARPRGAMAFDTLIVEQTDYSVTLKQTSEPDQLASLIRKSRVIVISDQAQRDGLPEHVQGWLTWPIRSASFTKVLHDQQLPNDSTEASSSPFERSYQSNTSLKVLVAEDNPINAMLVKSLLERFGHTVSQVEDGQQALDKFSADKFDLVLMDLHMPVMDGLTAIEQLRSGKIGSWSTEIPIIILSADGQDEVRQNAIAAGANDYLTKPLDFDAVGRLLEDVSKNKDKQLMI